MGAFVDERPPCDMPCVERLAPFDGGFTVMRLGEPVGELLELPARLQFGFGGQVRPRVALHVRKAALDARAGPCLLTGGLRAAQPVGDGHVRRGHAGEQRRVGRLGLVPTPLESQRLAALAVDGDDQAPAVAHACAVRHHRMMPGRHGRYRRMNVPAPGGALTQCGRITGRVKRALRLPARQPGEELARHARMRGPFLRHRRAQRAIGALPPLDALGGPAVLLHRPTTDRALLRFAGFRSHVIQPITRLVRGPAIFPSLKMIGRHAYCHKARHRL